MMSLADFRKRKLWQWALAYLAAAWLLLQVADLVGGRFGWPELWLRWLIIVLAIGFLATLVLGWYHGERSAQRVSGMEIGILSALLVIAGAAVMLVAHRQDVPVPAPVRNASAAGSAATPAVEQTSIAVLPFRNMSSDREQEYFSDGLTEELLNALAQVPELRVSAQASVFSFKGKSTTTDEIGRRLRVAHLVQGSVRKAGERIRVTVQLVDARSGFQKWSQAYDRDLSDVFAVQNEISRAIVDELRIRVADKPMVAERTADADAYAFYLRATQAMRQGGASRVYLAEGERLFSAALKEDPNYAAALSGLAEVYRWQAYHGLVARDQGYARAREVAKRALEIDPADAGAHGTLGIIADWYDRDFDVAEARYRRAIALNPSISRLHSYYGWLLVRLGRVQDGLAEGERAAQIDPLSIAALTNLASLYSFARQFDRAEALNRASLALDPNDVITLGNLATVYIHLHRNADAVKTAERAYTLDPEFAFAQTTLAYVYGRVGRRAEARKILVRLQQRPDVSPYMIAAVHVGLDDHDGAFQQLDRAVEGTDDQISDLGMDAVFDPLRSDPRMDALLARLKLKGYASPARSIAGG
jgi:TolB-like protein/tetratricopeptide (TPR) repeat protein